MEPDAGAEDLCDNGERQPDASLPDGGTADHREHGARVEHHNRPISAPIDPESTRPEEVA